MARRKSKKGGWYGEPGRHALAAKGIGSGRKHYYTPVPRFIIPRSYLSNIPKQSIQRELIKKAFIMGTIQVVPMARELYLGYTAAKLVYSSWNMIYNAYKNPETLKQEAYGIARDGVKSGLASYQTGLIWNRIEHVVPEPLKPEVNKYLTNIVSNITEEEISLVENALTAF